MVSSQSTNHLVSTDNMEERVICYSCHREFWLQGREEIEPIGLEKAGNYVEYQYGFVFGRYYHEDP